MDRRDTILTGDVLLFSGNTPTGFLLKTFVSSQWNHSGIAVRFVTDKDGNKQISLTDEGELYILETNTGKRTDAITNSEILGIGFSNGNWVFNKYNRIAVRRLHHIFRTPELANLTLQFVQNNRGSQFPTSSLPFVSVWLGISLSAKDENNNDMFCSEIMAHYFSYCIGPQYEKVTGIPYDGKLTTLFGSGSPYSEDMFTPGHYTISKTPNAPIFEGAEEEIYVAYADMWYIILQPLLIILFIMMLLWMSFPKI